MDNYEYLKKYSSPQELPKNLQRLANGEPVQYILGEVNFYGYNFHVDKSVLIPRFETETLVEKTLQYLQKYNLKKILDIGTGSGCIAITIKKELPSTQVSASDISQEALEVAKLNAQNNQADIEFITSDIFTNISSKYDAIISNPPYIAYNDEVEDIVKNNEPQIALYAANNGLAIYEQILKEAHNYLNPQSLIAFEIGSQQKDDLTLLAQKYFPNSHIESFKDLTNRDRYLFIFNNLE